MDLEAEEAGGRNGGRREPQSRHGGGNEWIGT
jgi:hypothetical protein